MAGSSASAAPNNDQDQQPQRPISPLSLASGNPNIFSDDYAESFNESYADSIAARSPRPSRTPSPTPSRSSLQHETSRTLFSRASSLSHTPSTRSRRSTSKVTDEANDRNRDETRRGVGPSIVTNFSMRQRASGNMAHRSVSSASDFAGSQSPMSPGEGPSHPYSMYPQGLAMSRTASIASSARPTSHSTSVRGPTHPYNLYTQNVGEGMASGNQQNSIPVGFTGSGSNFHRRYGPEGEDQDIIGADGHAEQLPPYSKYPDEINHKTVVASGLPVIGEQRAEETSPTLPTRNPTLLAPGNVPNSRQDTASTDEFMNEKSWERKTSKEKWRTKVFGIPLWSMLLIFLLGVIIAVVCGVVIGVTIGSKHPKSNKYNKPDHGPWSDAASMPSSTPTSTSSTSLLDVFYPMSTPSGIMPIATGTFPLNPGYPAAANYSSCLLEPQRPAWSCTLHDDALQMNVTRADNGTFLSLFPITDELQYGVQPPTTFSQHLELVQDCDDDDNYSYAWHFQTFYDKLVILDGDNSILPLNQKKRRDYHDPWYEKDSPFNQRKSASDPDYVDEQKAWFCYWNQTFLEVLVYVADESNQSTTTSSSLPSPSSSMMSTSSGTMSSSSSSTTSSIAIPSMTSGYPMMSKSSSGMPWLIPPPSIGHPEMTPTMAQPRSAPGNTPFPSPSPQRIKVEERRLPDVGAPPPICTLMTKNATDNSWKPSIGANGIIPVVALFEEDPTPTAAPTPSPGWHERRKRDVIPPDACGCEWYITIGQDY